MEEAAVLHADDRRYEAMLRGDAASLQELLADDLTYVHSDGSMEDKREYLHSLSTGERRYLPLDIVSRQVRFHRPNAILTGVIKADGQTWGRESTLYIRFTAVYLEQGGNWRMTAWQATRVDPSI